MSEVRKCEFCAAPGNQYYWSCWICGSRGCKEKARALYQIDTEES